MPSTVADIFAAAGTSRSDVERWRVPPSPPSPRTEPATGIYVVALTDQLDSHAGATAEPPISDAAVDELLALRLELTLDRARPIRQQLVERLAAFWFPDEVVLYIGFAGPRRSRPTQGELAKRVCEYYTTPLGANGPHAGGWPLKTLACLNDLYVHYGYCRQVDDAEDNGIEHFADHVSESSRAALHDRERVMPFANLEFPKGNAKNHGIRGARAPKTRRGARPDVHIAAGRIVALAPAESRTPRTAPTRYIAAATPARRSQKITEKDIQAGQMRIPIGATKTILPRTRQDIVVVLRGRTLACRWDPRYGEKEHSGVIRVGKAAARELLSPGDVLAVTVAADGSVGLA